jgi:hypothetical protein
MSWYKKTKATTKHMSDKVKYGIPDEIADIEHGMAGGTTDPEVGKRKITALKGWRTRFKWKLSE